MFFHNGIGHFSVAASLGIDPATVTVTVRGGGGGRWRRHRRLQSNSSVGAGNGVTITAAVVAPTLEKADAIKEASQGDQFTTTLANVLAANGEGSGFTFTGVSTLVAEGIATQSPTRFPTAAPTKAPTADPTVSPTAVPVVLPSAALTQFSDAVGKGLPAAAVQKIFDEQLMRVASALLRGCTVAI